MMTFETVSSAVKEGGSIRKAAKLLGKSYNSLQWWMARNGYRVEHTATLVKIPQQKEN